MGQPHGWFGKSLETKYFLLFNNMKFCLDRNSHPYGCF